MKFHPAILFVLLYLAFLGVVSISQTRLPEQIATHFNAAGEPNGWGTRESWRTTSLVLGTALPAAALFAFWMLRRVPVRMFNLPHRDHWLGPEERERTLAWLQRHGWWLACLEIAFFIGLEWLVVNANAAVPPHLENAKIFTLAGVFLVAIAAWIIQMQRRFSRVA